METRSERIKKQLTKGKEARETIKKLRAEGMSIVDISNKLGLSESTVRNAIK